ncbi:MAG TPA: hypothetical protein DEH25_04945 [Chloroflexi bacterium]|nr:hypothetical protein [Chloroflexota bacterium]
MKAETLDFKMSYTRRPKGKARVFKRESRVPKDKDALPRLETLFSKGCIRAKKADCHLLSDSQLHIFYRSVRCFGALLLD